MSVLLIGSLNMDINLEVEHFVLPGQTIPAKHARYSDGGKGLNQASAVSRLGGRVTILGCVGNDDNGHHLVKDLVDDGVNVEHIKYSSITTGLAMIEIEESGNNRIIVNRGANNDCTKEYILSKEELFKECDIVLLQQEIPLETIYTTLELAKKYHKTIILNPAPINKEFDLSYLKDIDYITPNEVELALLVNQGDTYKEKMEHLLELGIKNVITTLGDQGCLLLNQDGYRQYDAFKVQAIDTVGAGDCFNGALAAYLDKGNNLEDSIQFAQKASSLSVVRNGARDSMPTLEEVKNA